MTNEQVMSRPGTKFIGEVKAGTLIYSYKKSIFAIHPDHPPKEITGFGFLNVNDWKGVYRSAEIKQ